MGDLSDKNRFSTAWTYVTEGITDPKERLDLYRQIISYFLAAHITTEKNKTNLLNLIEKTDEEFRNQYQGKIRDKKTCPKDSTVQ